MTFLKRISLCFAAGLTACGAVESETTAAPAPAVVAKATASTPKSPTPKAETPAHLTDQKDEQPVQIEAVALHAEPYMLADSTPTYATLYLRCSDYSETISISVPQSDTPQRTTAEGLLISKGGEFGLVSLPFWGVYTVFLDEIPVRFPPIYKTITKQVDAAGGRFEPKDERILLLTPEDIYDILLPKLKTAKVMRLENRHGVGPSFELKRIKTDIEILEARCAPKDANE